MTRKLTKLRIDEVSLCTKGAGDGTRVLIQKNHDRVSRRERLRRMFDTVDFSKLKVAPQPVDDVDEEIDEIETGETTKLPGRMEEFVAALQASNPTLSREDAIHYLLHSAHGRSTAEHMSSTFKAKEPIMDRSTELQSIVKQHGGVVSMAKLFIAANKALGGVTEAEFTALMDVEAQKTRQPGERPNQAFARYYSAPENVELRKAIQIAKSTPAPLMSVEPVQVGGNDALDINDAKKAYQALTDLAEAQIKRSPTLTPAQAFNLVFQDPANAELANRAHRRPTATTSYAFPR